MGNEFFKTKFDTAERACNEVASFSLLWYDMKKTEFHEPKHGKRKKSLPEEGLMILQNRTETAMGSMAVITFRVLPAVPFRRDTC